MELEKARDVRNQLERLFVTRVRDPRRRRFAMGVAAADPNGQYGIAVRARSPEDLSQRDLALIAQFASNEVDVRYTGEITALFSATAASSMIPCRPLAMGGRVAHYSGVAGSLGFFARRNSDGAPGLISNNHVIAISDQGLDQDDILYPPSGVPSLRARDTVARLDGRYPRLNRRNPRVDCAFAALLDDVEYDPHNLAGHGRLDPRPVNAEDATEDVAKIGNSSGLKYGRVSAFEFTPLEVRYPLRGFVRFAAQIEVQRTGTEPFCCSGDSGSLLFTVPDNRPVGLVFAVAARGGPANTELTYANPIHAVLSTLDVTFVP